MKRSVPTLMVVLALSILVFGSTLPRASYDVSRNVLRIELPSECGYAVSFDGRLVAKGSGRVAVVEGLGGASFLKIGKVSVECDGGARFEINRSDIELRRFAYRPSSGTMYKLFIRSFFDSNGDGIGDLRGVTEKVHYIKSLADVVWLLPFHPASSYHGYDPIDLYSVSPEYGTLEDLEELIRVFNENGIAVVMDLVINHTSWEHPWFTDAVERGKDSPYWNYFIMSYERPANANNRWYSIKNSKGQEIWYFGLFDRSMPDLNFDNPAVRREVERIVDFWLTVGVNGFRVDAVKNFYGWEWSDAIIPSAEYSRELYRYIVSKDPNAVVVGEAYDGNTYILSKFAPLPVFNFRFMFELTSNYLGKDNMLGESTGWLSKDLYGSGYFHFPFLDNHDRNRLISVLIGAFGENEVSATKHYLLLNTLLLTMPGIPAIYYGNEIAQRGVRFPDAPWDMGIREPLQWYASGSGPGQAFWTRDFYSKHNVAGGAASAFDGPNDGVSVEEQEANSLSVLNFFRSLVELRRSHTLFVSGQLRLLSDSRSLYAYKVVDGGSAVLVLVNLNLRRSAELELDGDYELIWRASFDADKFSFGRDSGAFKKNTKLTVPPRNALVLRSL